MRIAALFFLLFSIAAVNLANAFSLDEMVSLKKAGLGEKLIVQLARKGYSDTATLLKFKEAGFSDDAILDLIEVGIKSGGGGKPVNAEKPATAELTADAKARIVWYRMYRGKPVVRNSKEIDKTIVSLTGKSLSVAWQPPQGIKAFVSALDIEAFTSPFLWDIAPSDSIEIREGERLIILRSSPSKLDHPQSDDNGYYELYLAVDNPALAERLKAFR